MFELTVLHLYNRYVEGFKLISEGKTDSAIDFKGQHICKSASLQLTNAVLEPSEDRADYHIELHFTVEIAAGPESYTHKSTMQLTFENVRVFIWKFVSISEDNHLSTFCGLLLEAMSSGAMSSLRHPRYVHFKVSIIPILTINIIFDWKLVNLNTNLKYNRFFSLLQ